MAKSKLPSPGTGGGSITKGLLKMSKRLVRTAGAIYRGLVGPEQEQTYGWTEQFFPSKPKSQKDKTTTVTSTNNLGPTPGMGMDVEQILDFMKENYADEKRYRQVQQGFEEERANEEGKRHKELITALKKFTGEKTTATTTVEKEGGGLLETLMNMFKAFEEKIKGMISSAITTALNAYELFKNSRLLASLMSFLTNPIFRLLTGPLLMVGGILGLAALLSAAVKFMPDYSKLTAEEAKAALEGNDRGLIEKYGGREKLMEIINREKELAREALEGEAELTEQQRANYQKVLDLTVTPQTVTELGPVPPRPDTTGGKNAARAANWDRRFGATHNPDGTPKVRTQAKPLPSGVEESTAGAGRGGDAQYVDYLARMDQERTGGQASFGVRPMGIRAASVPPPASPVAQLTDMNLDLAEMFSLPSGGSSIPLLQQSNTQSAQNEPPLPSTATQRDDEPMASVVFRQQRNRARAY